MEQQVGEEAHGFAVKRRVSVGPGHQLRNVTGGASNLLKEALPAQRLVRDAASGWRREETEKVLEIVDAPQTGSRVANVFRIRCAVARPGPPAISVGRHFGAEEVI